MFEYRILIPVTADKKFDPACGYHKPSTHAWFKNKLIENFGGFTIAGNCDGAWKGDGRVIYDTSMVYYVSIGNKLTALKKLLGEACKKFKQNQIYCVKTGHAFFVEPSNV
jgi:hypothetical protein